MKNIIANIDINADREITVIGLNSWNNNVCDLYVKLFKSFVKNETARELYKEDPEAAMDHIFAIGKFSPDMYDEIIAAGTEDNFVEVMRVVIACVGYKFRFNVENHYEDVTFFGGLIDECFSWEN